MQGCRTGIRIAGLLAAAFLAAPAARAQDKAPAAGGPEIEPPHKTEMVDGPALQIVFGDRAVFHLDDKGEPVLDDVEKGQLAIAHPTGAVKETFAAPGPGKLAIAIDGSAAKQASYLKIWNGLDHPVIYHAGVLAVIKGKLKPMDVKVCAAPAGGTNQQTWPLPIAAVAVANFSAAPDAAACQ